MGVIPNRDKTKACYNCKQYSGKKCAVNNTEHSKNTACPIIEYFKFKD